MKLSHRAGVACVARVSLAAVLLVCIHPLWAQDATDKPVTVERNLGSDHFVTGCPAVVARPVAGDLIAAGCNVEVLSEVAGDLVAAGGELRLTAPVKQGVYAAGGRVVIDAAVQRNVRVAGGRVTVGPNARVTGNVTVGAGEVEIEGAIGGYLQAGAGKIRINGPVTGDVEIGAGELELGPGALIGGKLRYASKHELRRDPGAQVRGGVERIENAGGWPALEHWKEGARRGTGWVWSIGLWLLAAVLLIAFPQPYSGIASTVRTRWALAMLVGFITLVCVPVAALICVITLVGIPLALLAITFFILLLFAGYASAGIALGDAGLRQWSSERAAKLGWRIAAAVLAMVLLSVLGRIPLVGWLVTLAAMLTGIGAMLMQLRHACARSSQPAA